MSYRFMEDAELVRRCLQRDRRAEKALYDQFSGQMYAICFRYMKDAQEAQDVFQEGMIKVYNKLHTWKGAGPLGGWMRQIFIHCALNQIKTNQKHWSVSIESIPPTENLDVSILSELHTEAIMDLIQKLPIGYRTVFNLFAIEGYSHAEIATLLEVSESTSKTQFLKAKAKLKSLIETPLKLTTA
jgi:RNA polymerase sigma-70 factor (ECF subfamily)